MGKSRRNKGMPARSAGHAFGQAALWFAVGAVPVLLLALVTCSLGNSGFFPPILIFGPLFAGLGLMGLVAVAQDWAWFYETPIARQWIGIFGENAGRVVLRIMLGFLLMAGIGTAFVPFIVPAKKADLVADERGPQPVEVRPNQRQPVEVAPAFEMPATVDKMPGDAGFVDAALKDLRSGRRDFQMTALGRMQGLHSPQERPTELRQEIVKLLAADDLFIPGHAAYCLAVWGTAEDLPALEAALEKAKQKKDFGFETACRQAMDKIRKR